MFGLNCANQYLWSSICETISVKQSVANEIVWSSVFISRLHFEESMEQKIRGK